MRRVFLLFAWPVVDERLRFLRAVGLLGVVTILAGLGGCAQSPRQVATSTSHPKEYFPASIYGPASRRVIADGQPVPRGGGQYLVGRPYTVAGQTYYPSERKVTQVGLASWYGDAFHGRLTANGEIYDRDSFTAAHPTMPLPSYARVTNLRNNYSMIVRVNDRGPYHANRIMDVSRRVAEALDFQRGGTSKIKVEYVGRASLAGSDDSRLYATLRTNGPARVDGLGDATMVAATEAKPKTRIASLDPAVSLARSVKAEPDRVVSRWEPTPPIRSKPAKVLVRESEEPSRQQGRKTLVTPRPERLASRSMMIERPVIPASRPKALAAAARHDIPTASHRGAVPHAMTIASLVQKLPSRPDHGGNRAIATPPARPHSAATKTADRHASGLHLTRTRQN